MKTMILKILGIVLFAVLALSAGAESPFPGDRDLPALNTAARAGYLSPAEKEVIFEINKLRANPKQYAETSLVPLVAGYQGKKLYIPGEVPILTQEGVSALHDCIRELKRAAPQPPLYPDYGLTLAARDHVSDQSRTGKTGHTGSDRSSSRTRIERYGSWQFAIAENIFYGESDARLVVIHLLIDDGVPGRGHRKNFLSSDFRLVGVAFGKHPKYKNMCVMDFAGSFQQSQRQ